METPWNSQTLQIQFLLQWSAPYERIPVNSTMSKSKLIAFDKYYSYKKWTQAFIFLCIKQFGKKIGEMKTMKKILKKMHNWSTKESSMFNECIKPRLVSSQPYPTQMCLICSLFWFAAHICTAKLVSAPLFCIQNSNSRFNG